MVAPAQFTQVDWDRLRGDSLLPLCSQVVNLPADYAQYNYSAHIEYPEFQEMSKADVARYSLEDKYGFLPETPPVDCYVGIQAKQAQLDVTFLPVVMRDGNYYRINSYKLVIDKVRRSHPMRASAIAPQERYSSASLLAEGRWVRVAVEKNGVYKITHSELKSMGFSDPSKVRLYGYGGHRLSETSIEQLPDDLCEVPLWREDDYLLFYANGTISWELKSGRYVHSQNVYSLYGYYFLTEKEEAPMAFPKEQHTATISALIDTYTEYTLHEKEEKSLCSYGRALVESYDFSQGRSKSYKLDVEDAVEGDAVLDLSFATNGNNLSRVAISDALGSIGTLTIPRVMTGEIGKLIEGRFSIKDGVKDNFNITLTHTTTDNSVTGFLDFIRLNYKRRLTMRGSEFNFRGDAKNGYATFAIGGCNSDTRVWDVTSPNAIKELAGMYNDGVYSVVAPADGNSNMVAVNIKGYFPSVKLIGEVPNQNLHSLGQTDMVIIVPSNGKYLPAAERLAEAHRTMDSLTVAVVTAQQVYNEFSSGTPDVTAYRRLMKMLYDRAATATEAPKYLLLLGDGWYDNRMLTFPGRNQEDFLLTYESQNSVNAIRSYVLEDYAGYLDDNEGGNHLRDKVDLGIGRIPAKSAAEADAVVDKIITYMLNKDAGSWQNVIALLGDDGDYNMPNQHMKDADSIASVFNRYYPSYILDRIYWDNFQIEKSATGNRYPAVTQAIRDRLDEGALLVNYSGHGSANLLSHEMSWKASDMASVKSPRVPFWVTASCDIGPFDMGDNSVAESAILNPAGGAIGLFTTTRTVLQSYNAIINKEFTRLLMSPTLGGEMLAVGDASRMAKCNVIASGSDNSENKLQYVLLGDPALRLKYPQYKLVVEKMNGVDANDTPLVSAGAVLNIEGRVEKIDGSLAEDFTGVLSSTLFDSAEEINTRNNTGLGVHTYNAHEKTLFAGSDSVRNGRFSIKIPVPMDISYSNDYGMLNLFAVDSGKVHSAQGRYINFKVGGTASDVENDGQGPLIKAYLNTPYFESGDEVNATPCLLAELYDENGINTIGTGIGHDITVVIDNSPQHTYNLNSIFEPAVGDYTRGTIKFPLNTLEQGEHTLLLRAWDFYNNSSTVELNFYVNSMLAPGLLEFKFSPSPAVSGSPVEFTLAHNRPLSELEVTIDVFNFQGQILWSNSESAMCDDYTYRYTWDGKAQGGQPLPPGVYLVRACVTSGGEIASTKTGKIVVVNNK